MKTQAFVLASVLLAGAGAQAQDCTCGSPGHGGFAGGSWRTGLWSGGGLSVSHAVPVLAGSAGDPGPPLPYSYYSAYPGPARVYVSYTGNDLFPFGGQPYGHVYDRWGWAAMGVGSSSGLARYFYPPVP